MTSHHTKFQLDSLKRSQVIPLQKKKGLLYIPGGWIQKEFFKEIGCLKTFKTAKKKVSSNKKSIFNQKKYHLTSKASFNK